MGRGEGGGAGFHSGEASQAAYWPDKVRFSPGFFFFFRIYVKTWLLRWLSGKESTCNAGDVGLIPGWGRPPAEGHGTPLQYSCLGKPMDRGVWWATVHEVAKSQT